MYVSSWRRVFCSSGITVSYLKSQRHEKLRLVIVLDKGEISVLRMAAFLEFVMARNKQILLRARCGLCNEKSIKEMRKRS